MRSYIRTHNQLLDLSSPRVMAIVNITPDSFYTSCRSLSENEILATVEKFISEGADILDIGACSTRPDSTPATLEEEWKRLSVALTAIRSHWKDIIISVDTFRANIAERALLAGADIINDVYGGEADNQMWNVLCKYHTPYILTHSVDIQDIESDNNPLSQVVTSLEQKLHTLHKLGIADVIVDPGFGFNKTIKQNYKILHQLDILKETLDAPILVGVSRKSMLYKPLNTTPDQVLPATIAAQTIALERGASILRVHDVAATKQAIEIFRLTNNK
jgi:dihydropteroate synthase